MQLKPSLDFFLVWLNVWWYILYSITHPSFLENVLSLYIWTMFFFRNSRRVFAPKRRQWLLPSNSRAAVHHQEEMLRFNSMDTDRSGYHSHGKGHKLVSEHRETHQFLFWKVHTRGQQEINCTVWYPSADCFWWTYLYFIILLKLHVVSLIIFFKQVCQTLNWFN